MPDALRPPSALGSWLEDALRSRVLPSGALAAAAGAGLLYLFGLVPEAVAGAVVSVAAPFAAAVFAVRPALAAGRDPLGRGLASAAALGAFLLAAGPALATVLPGSPLFQGELDEVGQAMAVPPGVSGRVRVLVSGRLREAGEPEVGFSLSGTEPAVDGRLSRSFGYTRVGRGSRARVAHDHTSDWYEVSLPPGVREIRLEKLQGRPGSALLVTVHREWIPRALVLALVASVLLAAAVSDARLGSRGDAVVPVGMALAFGLLVDHNATPTAAVGPAVGGVLLGGMAGALVAAAAGWLLRRLVPPAGRRGGKSARGLDE